MNKEQIAFIAVLVVLASVWFLGSKADGAPPRKRSASKDLVAVAGEEHKGFWIKDDEGAWAVLPARNPYLAPKDTADLDRLDLVPPPLPLLIHHGLPLRPPIKGAPLQQLRHDLKPDAKIALPAPGARAPSAETSAPGSAEAKAEAEKALSEVDTSNVGMTLADRLKQTTEEKIRREKLQEDARRAEADRRKTLDQVIWLAGGTSYGTIMELDKKESRYVLKVNLDRIRSDAAMADDERKKRLDAMKFVFREDRGPGKTPSRNVYTATALQRIDFAASNPVHKYNLQKLETAADDLGRQEDLVKLIFDASEMVVAAAHIEELVGRGVSSPKLFGMLSDAHRRQFRYDLELKSLERGLELFKDDPALLGRFGQLSLRLGLRQKAEGAFSKVLASDPPNALAHLGLGQVLVESEQGEEAIQHLRQAEAGIGLDKEQQVRTLVLLGEAWCLKGNLQTASTYFNQVLDRDPKSARGAAGATVVSLAASGAAAAKAIVDRGREHSPLNGTLAYLDGVCLLRLGKWVEARDALLVAMELDPLVTSHARTAMSYLLEKTGQDEAALGEADQALVADPLDNEARLQRARILLNVGDLTSARTEFLAVLEAMPDRADILAALGDVAFKSGSTAEAARFYARCEARDPGYPDLLARRLICEVRRRRDSGAEAFMKRIDAKLEQDPFIQAAQGYYYYGAQKTEETLRRFRLIVEKKSGSTELQAYAQSTMSAIEENLSREKWVDNFNRTGGQLLRGWKREIPAGVNIAVNDGRARFEGTQRTRSDDATVLFQEKAGKLFYSFSTDLDMKAEPGSLKGIGIMTFNPSPKEPDPWAGLQKREGRAFSHLGLQVVLAPHGKLQWRKIVQGRATEWEDVPGTEYSGGPVTLGIELADTQKSLYRVIVDQRVVMPAVEIPGLSRRSGQVELQVFCQAQVDRPISFTADNVTLVSYKK